MARRPNKRRVAQSAPDHRITTVRRDHTVRVLPSSFIGGPRSMKGLYHDGMAIVRAYTKPDYFVTMTYNPLWSEITDLLINDQTASSTSARRPQPNDDDNWHTPRTSIYYILSDYKHHRLHLH